MAHKKQAPGKRRKLPKRKGNVVKKIEGFNQFCWVAAFVVLAVGIVGNLVFYRQIAKEDADAALRLAHMNAKANAPAVRYSHVDENGVTQHTICSGGGWCVTDRVPPEDFSQASPPKRPGAWSVIDGALMQQLIEAQRGKGVAND